MKLIKIVLAVLLVSALTIGLVAGCSDKNEETSAPTQSETEQTDADDNSGDTDEVLSFDYSADLDDRGFWKGVTALDYVTLFDYENIEVGEEVHAISDEDVQQQIDQLMDSFAENIQIDDRAVEDGDTVNIDYVGSVDGTEFEGGSTGGAGTEVTVGKTVYIDDFLQQLIGHEPGETFDVEVTFPDDYGVEELNGKDAVFATTINHIVETEIPELTDDFVAENFAEERDWSTVSELSEGIKAEMQDSAISLYLQDHILEASTVSDVPESLINYQEQSMLDYYQGYAASYGVDLEAFVQTYMELESTEALLTENRAQNEEMAKFYLIIQAIAEDADISLSDEEVEEYFTAEYSAEDYTALVENAGLPYMKMIVVNQKVLEQLQENVVLS